MYESLLRLLYVRFSVEVYYISNRLHEEVVHRCDTDCDVLKLCGGRHIYERLLYHRIMFVP